MTTPIANRLYADHRPSRRIDYGSKRVIRQRARDKQRQRERAAAGNWIVGRFILADSTVLLEAIERTPAWSIEPHHPLTRNFHAFYRWNTRQAARQWLIRNPDPRCQPVNLEQLRGCQPETETPQLSLPADNSADVPGQMMLV
jgi:hypothetical protein